MPCGEAGKVAPNGGQSGTAQRPSGPVSFWRIWSSVWRRRTRRNCSPGCRSTSGASGYYYFSNTVDLSQVYTSKVTANIQVVRIDNSSLFDSVSGLFDSKTGNFDGADFPDDIDIGVEISTRNTTSESWSSWQPFLTASYTSRYMKFRIKLLSESSNVTPQVRQLSVSIDMPDRIDSGNDIVSGTTAKVVTFTNGAFKEVPSIGIRHVGHLCICWR